MDMKHTNSQQKELYTYDLCIFSMYIIPTTHAYLNLKKERKNEGKKEEKKIRRKEGENEEKTLNKEESRRIKYNQKEKIMKCRHCLLEVIKKK